MDAVEGMSWPVQRAMMAAGIAVASAMAALSQAVMR